MALKIVSTVLLAAGLLMAQGHKGGGGNNNSGMMGEMSAQRPGPLDQLAQMLKLTRDQRKDVKGILDDAQKDVAPLRDSMAKSREQIAAAIEAGKSQDEIDQAVKSFSVIEAQVTAAEAKAFTRIFAGLDAGQKANQQGLVTSLMFLHELFKRKNWNAQSAD